MRISVAMAAYNGAEYIIEQLESVRNQTRSVDEVIICDDQSKDNTVKVVEDYLKQHNLEKDWHIFVNEKNLGYASNFIGAADKTTGDIILFCDQDDIWVSDRVERFEKLMKEYEEILLVGSEFKPFTSSDDAPSVPGWEMKQMRYDETLEKLAFAPENIPIGCQGCTMCMKRSFYTQTRPFWYTGWAHDEFVWKMALCLDGLYMYHSSTLKRRLHSNNVTMHKMRDNQKRIKFLEDLLACHEATISFAKSISLSDEKMQLLEKNRKGTILRIGLLKDKKYWNAVKLLFGYRECYHKLRAIPVEFYMALKN